MGPNFRGFNRQQRQWGGGPEALARDYRLSFTWFPGKPPTAAQPLH